MTAELPPEAPLAGVSSNDEPSTHQLLDEVRRLRVLVDVADTVTQQLALDHQLPRLIDLITDALDAERATLFLHDRDTGELFSRVLSGEGVTEIRIPASAGIAGAVFGRGAAEIIADAYQDNRFNPEIDRRTGYRTRDILCAPLRNRGGDLIGVTQVLNKRSGEFAAADLALAEAINRHAASAASTVEALKSRAVLRRLDLIQVKGKSQPTLAYEALDHYDSERFPRLPALIGAYEAGLDSYQRRDWADAIQHFGDAIEVAPSDQPSQVFIYRCRYYNDNPPPENWNGVWIMEDK